MSERTRPPSARRGCAGLLAVYALVAAGCPVLNPSFDGREHSDDGPQSGEDDHSDKDDSDGVEGTSRGHTEGSGRGHQDSQVADTGDNETETTTSEIGEDSDTPTSSLEATGDDEGDEDGGEDSSTGSSGGTGVELEDSGIDPATATTDTTEDEESGDDPLTSTETIGDQTCTRTLCFDLNGDATGGAGRISGTFEYAIYIENVAPLQVVGAEIYTGLVNAPTSFSLWTSAIHEGGDNFPLHELLQTKWTMSSTPGWQGIDFESTIDIEELGFWLVWDTVDGSISPLTIMGETTAIRFRSRGHDVWDEARLSSPTVRLYCCEP